MLKAPTLTELKSRQCTPEELQAAIVQLVEHHNGLVRSLQAMSDSGRIRTTHDALMNTPYGL